MGITLIVENEMLWKILDLFIYLIANKPLILFLIWLISLHDFQLYSYVSFKFNKNRPPDFLSFVSASKIKAPILCSNFLIDKSLSWTLLLVLSFQKFWVWSCHKILEISFSQIWSCLKTFSPWSLDKRLESFSLLRFSFRVWLSKILDTSTSTLSDLALHRKSSFIYDNTNIVRTTISWPGIHKQCGQW